MGKPWEKYGGTAEAEKPAGKKPWEKYGGTAAPEPAPAVSAEEDDGVVGGMISSGWQGLTMGFGDKIESGLRSTFLGEDYDEALAKERGQTEKFRKENPALAMGSEIAGAMAPTVLAGLLSGGAGGAGVLASTGARMAGTAAASGALYGAGESEGDMFSAEQGVDALKGAATGLATFGIMKGAGMGASAGLKKVLQKAGVKPTSNSLKQVYKDLYAKVDNSGMELTGEAVDGLMEASTKAVNARAKSAVSREAADDFIEKIPAMLGPRPTVSAVEEVRRAAYHKLPVEDRRMAYGIQNAFDDYVKKLKPSQVRFSRAPAAKQSPDAQAAMSGWQAGSQAATRPRVTTAPGGTAALAPPTPRARISETAGVKGGAGETAEQMIATTKQAREAFQQKLKFDEVDKLLKRAAASVVDKGRKNRGKVINAELQRFKLAQMDKNLFTKKELDAVDKIIKGSLGNRVLRHLGELTPALDAKGVLSATPHVGMAMAGNPLLAMATYAGQAAGSAGARGAANRGTQKAAEQFRNQIGGMAPPAPLMGPRAGGALSGAAAGVSGVAGGQDPMSLMGY